MQRAKYGKDAPFTDPVVRCDSCSKVIRAATIQKLGMCECGNRKIRNIQALSPEEMKQLQDWNVDPNFIALFQAVDNG